MIIVLCLMCFTNNIFQNVQYICDYSLLQCVCIFFSRGLVGSGLRFLYKINNSCKNHRILTKSCIFGNNGR